MARLFLSYARHDAATATRLAAALESAGHEVWWDALIEGGARYSQRIDRALAEADAVVVLWSAHSVESDWVRDEAAHGRDRHRLIPLTLDRTEPPLGFRQIQAVDMSRWHGRTGGPQLHALERAIAAAMGHKAEEPSRSGASPITRRQALVAGGATAAVAGTGAVIGWQSGLLSPEPPHARSIAVLPFKNISGDSGQAYLAEGLTEEIRAALARNTGLVVLAATSSNSVSDMVGDARAIARRLDVAYLLEGSVQRSRDRVSVATNLTNGSSGFSEWSQRVERPLGDIFAFQNEIAGLVSNAMSVRMATASPAPGGTRNVKAYVAFLQGRSLYNLAGGEETDRKARAFHELAITEDPNFALARAGLSRVLASIASSQASAGELQALYSAAIREAKRAAALAPTLPEAHLALGYALFAGKLDVAGARPAYDAAYRHGQRNADILLLYALYAVRIRRFASARSAIERALALDPLNSRTWRAAGSVDLASNRPAEAIARYERALSLNPSMANARALKGFALIGLTRWADARQALEAEPSAMFRLTGMAILGRKTGDQALATRSFDQLVADVGDSALYQQAQVLAQWGRPADALNRLEKALQVGDSGLVALVTDPFVAPLAGEPRFQALAKQIGFV